MTAGAATGSRLGREVRVACEAAREAGAAAMAFYGTASAVAKEGGSPVTEADHAANRVILDRLETAFPDDAVLSEEARDSTSRLSRSRVWIVDPLDGTKEFLACNGEFAIMIGLAVDARAVLGVVFLPATDTLFAAEEGQGAWVEREGRRTLLRCSEPFEPLRLVGSRSHPDPLLVKMQGALGITDVLPSGSVGVKCGLIAEGKRDLYVHPVPYLKEWDTCAPEVIVREAGGDVVDCLGAPLRYNKADPHQPGGILACGAGVLDVVLDPVATIYSDG